MNKEFENQKQEIINALDEIFRGSDLRMHNQPPDVPNKVITIEDLSKGFNLLKQLQPPKLPTCATCNKFDGCGILYYTPNMDTDGFGCTLHSDYEVAKKDQLKAEHTTTEDILYNLAVEFGYGHYSTREPFEIDYKFWDDVGAERIATALAKKLATALS